MPTPSTEDLLHKSYLAIDRYVPNFKYVMSMRQTECTRSSLAAELRQVYKEHAHEMVFEGYLNGILKQSSWSHLDVLRLIYGLYLLNDLSFADVSPYFAKYAIILAEDRVYMRSCMYQSTPSTFRTELLRYAEWNTFCYLVGSQVELMVPVRVTGEPQKGYENYTTRAFSVDGDEDNVPMSESELYVRLTIGMSGDVALRTWETVKGILKKSPSNVFASDPVTAFRIGAAKHKWD